MVFSVPEGAGQLFKALSVFALRELDMTKIESRPMRSKPIQLADGAGQALPYSCSQIACAVQHRVCHVCGHTDF